MADLADDRTIYHVRADKTLVPMKQRPYDSEDLLQTLLADNPELLGGGRDGPGWLLVQREMPVPDQEGGSGRWSLDHLFIDDHAIPTLVEVKRASDTRIRREVVGQLLDYAANGAEYWPPGAMRSALEDRLGTDEATTAISEEFGADPEEFWQQAESNLHAGRVRLIVLADVIPQSLRRIIEFLNERMPDTEVLAMEVRQYLGEGTSTIVPRIIGDTTTARRVKGTNKPRYEELLANAEPGTRTVADHLKHWTEKNHGELRPARTSMAYWVNGHHVVRLYPVEDRVEFMLNRIHNRGLHIQAEQMKKDLQDLCPSETLSEKHLRLPTRDLVRNWGPFSETILPQYLKYLEFPETESTTVE